MLLNLGHAEAFLWAEASVYAITSFCAGLILTIMVATRGRLGKFSATVAGVSLVLLPLGFGGGVLYVPFLGLWLGFSGYRSLKSRNVRRRMAGRIAIFFTMTALVLTAAYLVGYKQSRFDEREESTAFQVGPGAVVKTSLKYLSMSFGPAVQPPIWPVSGAVVLGLLSVCGRVPRRFNVVAGAEFSPRNWTGPFAFPDRLSRHGARGRIVACFVVS